MTTSSDTGVDAFIAGLQSCGHDSNVANGVVTFTVEPFDGAHAGQSVQTGVGTAELTGWPLVPPHWVHLPSEIRFTRTNSQDSAIPGWSQHSRDLQGWGDAQEPAQAWIAHVRAVIEQAI